MTTHCIIASTFFCVSVGVVEKVWIQGTMDFFASYISRRPGEAETSVIDFFDVYNSKFVKAVRTLCVTSRSIEKK